MIELFSLGLSGIIEQALPPTFAPLGDEQLFALLWVFDIFQDHFIRFSYESTVLFSDQIQKYDKTNRN